VYDCAAICAQACGHVMFASCDFTYEICSPHVPWFAKVFQTASLQSGCSQSDHVGGGAGGGGGDEGPHGEHSGVYDCAAICAQACGHVVFAWCDFTYEICSPHVPWFAKVFQTASLQPGWLHFVHSLAAEATMTVLSHCCAVVVVSLVQFCLAIAAVCVLSIVWESPTSRAGAAPGLKVRE